MSALEQALRERVLLLNTTPRNPAWSDVPEDLPLRRPDLVRDWSRQLLDAGADILETQSYGADALTCEITRVDCSQIREWNRAAVRLARLQGQRSSLWVLSPRDFLRSRSSPATHSPST